MGRLPAVAETPTAPSATSFREGQEGLLREFIEEHYHVARPHQGLGVDTPIPTESPPHLDGPTKLVATPVLGGLHRRYERQAA